MKKINVVRSEKRGRDSYRGGASEDEIGIREGETSDTPAAMNLFSINENVCRYMN